MTAETNIFTHPLVIAALSTIVTNIILLIATHIFTNKREHSKWIKEQKQKSFTSILKTITFEPKDQDGIKKWTYEIRAHSQSIHLLFKDGTAPNGIKESLEEVFQLAQKKKDNLATESWDQEMRDATRTLRIQLAKNL
ncbi:hypothetical protein [Salinibius halmophilus]|uniref:hypothetical protein n=1 Tax=Salinibius halmophilus TaxID=1853216 RepID=UPI000E670243|nr:hypothetical protein [Salinibius halmophilus]